MQMNAVAVLVAAVATAALAGPVFADSYVCAIKVKRAQSWIPTEIRITHDQGSGAVQVTDVLSAYFLKKPVAGKVIETTTLRITYGWAIPAGRNKAGEKLLPVVYRAVVDRGGGPVAVLAEPEGADKHYWSRGNCRLG